MRRHFGGAPYFPMRTALVLFLSLFLLGGCGGSSGGGGNPSPSADFSLSVPANASTEQGSLTTVTIGMTAINGFNSQVSVTISGMPIGVTATPSQFNLSPGGQQSVVIAASLTAAVATSALSVTGTSGTLQHSNQIGFKVSVLQGPPPALARIRYVQTDTQWDSSFFNFFPQILILYHVNTHRFFLSDTSLNQVVVIDAKTEKRIGQIPVPGAFVGDISPDQSTIYIGTQVGDLYEIDPVAMAVKARIPAVQIGPRGFPTYEVRALADGRLALLGGEGGIPAVDGFSAVGIWDRATNALLIAGSAGVQSGCALQDHIVEFSLTADRSRILLGSGVSLALAGGHFAPMTPRLETNLWSKQILRGLESARFLCRRTEKKF